MVLGVIAIGIIAVLSAVIGGLAIYTHSQQREQTNSRYWSAATALAFIFGILPGVIVISAWRWCRMVLRA
jgi:hypothetical protein